MREIIYLAFLAFVASTRIDLFTMDCSGSFRGFLSEDTDFFEMGMNLGMVKRGLDAVVDLVHDRVRCACSDITDKQISTAFTPNIESMLNAIHGVKQVEELPCSGKNLMRVDELLGGLMEQLDVKHENLPDTCNIDSWQKNDHCAFKMPLGDDLPEFMAKDAHVFFAAKHCPNSIWPFISLSIEGSFFDYAGNPCNEASPKCGPLTCGRIHDAPDEYECRKEYEWFIGQMIEVVNCDDGRLYCEPGYNKYKSEDEGWFGCQANSTKPIEFEKEVIPSTLEMFKFFNPGTDCHDYDTCNIGLKLQNALLSKVNSWLGINKRYDAKHAAFCGVPEIMDMLSGESTDAHRLQSTMSRTVSAVTQIGRLHNKVKEFISSFLEVNVPRRLEEDESEDQEGEEEDPLSQIFSMLSNSSMVMEPWTTGVEDVVSDKRVLGDSSLWHMPTPVEKTVNIMKKTCSNQYNFLGNHGIGFKSYFMKFPTLLRDLIEVIRPVVQCRNPGITESEMREQFLLFEPSFWMKMFGEEHDFDRLDSNPQKWAIETIFRGKKATCHRWQASREESDEISVNYTDKFSQSSVDPSLFDGNDYDAQRRCEEAGRKSSSTSCGDSSPPKFSTDNIPQNSEIVWMGKKTFSYCNCEDKYDNTDTWKKIGRHCRQVWQQKKYFVPENHHNEDSEGNKAHLEEDEDDSDMDVPMCSKCYERLGRDYNTYKVECEETWTPGPPKIKFPDTCSLDYFRKTGKCSFQWDYLAKLFDFKEMGISFHMERCPANPSDLSVEINCVGNDCADMFSLFDVPCSSDSDCGGNKCMPLELCDPVLDMFNKDNSSFMLFPADDGKCQTTEICSDTTKFRNDLVKAIMKVHDLDVTKVSANHVGICTPTLMTKLSSDDTSTDMEKWSEEMIKEENGVSSLNGMISTPNVVMPPTDPPSQPPPKETPVFSEIPLFTSDCSGAIHSEFKSPFLGWGVDLAWLKRALDGLMDIIHSHVKCACPSADDASIKQAYSVAEILHRVIAGEIPPDLGKCTKNLSRPDDLLKGMFDALGLNIPLPDSCTYAKWLQSKECSLKFALPLPEDLGENHIMIVSKGCGDSIWSYMAVSGHGPLFEHLMKPCHDDSECGGYHCSDVTFGPDTNRECMESNDPGCPCRNCHPDHFPDPAEPGMCKAYGRRHKFTDSSLISPVLSAMGIFGASDGPMEESDCTICSVVKNVRKKVLGWGRKSLFGDTSRPYSATPFKFCGLDMLTKGLENTEGLSRHRQVMKRISSHLTRLGEFPMGELFNLPLDEVFGHLNDIFENKWSLPNGRHLEETTDFELPFELPKLESWVPSSVPNDKISGAYYQSRFHTETSDSSDKVNLLRVSCDSSVVLGDMGRGAYFPRINNLMALFEEIVVETVKCRKSLKSLSIHDIRARFLVFDPSFWLRMFVNPDENVGPKAHDLYDIIRDVLEGIIASEDDLDPFAPDFNSDKTTSGKLPKMVMPVSCNLKTFIQTGHCTFLYQNLSPLFSGADVSLNVDIGRCPQDKGGFSMVIDCVGSDCDSTFTAKSEPCSKDADCSGNSKCEQIEMCDIVGSVLWGDVTEIMENFWGSNCSQNSFTCSQTDPFRQSLIDLMLKIEDSTSTAGSATGMCSPIDAADVLDSEATASPEQEWVATVMEENNGLITIKGLALADTRPPTTLSPTKNPTLSPTTLSPTTLSPVPSPTELNPDTHVVVTTVTTTVEAKLDLGSTDAPLKANEIEDLKAAVVETFEELLKDEDDVTVEVTISQTEITRRRRHLLAWSTTADVVITSSVEIDDTSTTTPPDVGATVMDLITGSGKDNFKATLEEKAMKNDLEVTVAVVGQPQVKKREEKKAVPRTQSPTLPPQIISGNGSGFISPSIVLFAMLSVVLF